MIKAILLLILLYSCNLFSQEKEQILEEVKVNNWIIRNKEKYPFFSLNRQEIQQGSYNDLGELLSRLPGLNIKDYGGLGGLKTVSSRGINGTHIGIYQDEFNQNISSIGEIDLSTIQVNQLNEVNYIHSGQDNRLHQISSYFNAQNIFLYTIGNQFSNKKLNLYLSNKLGSFSQRDISTNIKFNTHKFIINTYYNNRYSKGNFPFIYKNYSQNISLTRDNNQIKEQYGGVRFAYKINNNLIINYFLNLKDLFRELPSAVILYSNEKGQFIQNKSINNQISLNLNTNKKWTNILYAQYQKSYLKYVDSTFLNLNNILINEYKTKQILGGFHSKINFIKFSNSFGFEYENSSLNIDTNIYNRTIYRFLIMLYIHTKIFNIELSNGLLNTYKNKQYSLQNSLIWTPVIQINTNKSYAVIGEIMLNIKRTSRLPSFAEMYFQNISNANLLPEIANQISLNSNNNFKIFNRKILFNNSFYISSITNKIVAIPAKNLFTWTIKNYDKVLSYGSEHTFNIELLNKTNYRILTIASYSFSNSINDNKNSKLYRQQLPYIPIHTIQSSINFQIKNFSTILRFIYISSRYSLPENIQKNMVESFYTFDILFSNNYIYKKHKFSAQFGIYNLLNKNYEYVKSYPMPRRHYSIQINYEIF